MVYINIYFIPKTLLNYYFLNMLRIEDLFFTTLHEGKITSQISVTCFSFGSFDFNNAAKKYEI